MEKPSDSQPRDLGDIQEATKAKDCPPVKANRRLKKNAKHKSSDLL